MKRYIDDIKSLALVRLLELTPAGHLPISIVHSFIYYIVTYTCVMCVYVCKYLWLYVNVHLSITAQRYQHTHTLKLKIQSNICFILFDNQLQSLKLKLQWFFYKTHRVYSFIHIFICIHVLYVLIHIFKY